MREKALLITLLFALSACQPETPAQQSSVPMPVIVPASAVTAVEIAPAQEAVAAAVVEKAAQPELRSKRAAETGDKASSPVVAEKVVPAAVVPAVAAKPEVKVGSAVSEEDAMRLAKNNNCLVCHAIDRKLVGPAWRDVAAKYRANSDAEAMLMNKIAKGGSGAWGSVVMPSYPRISEAERKILAGFVLSL